MQHGTWEAPPGDLGGDGAGSLHPSLLDRKLASLVLQMEEAVPFLRGYFPDAQHLVVLGGAGSCLGLASSLPGAEGIEP